MHDRTGRRVPHLATAWQLGVCGAPTPGFPGEATRGPIRPSKPKAHTSLKSCKKWVSSEWGLGGSGLRG